MTVADATTTAQDEAFLRDLVTDVLRQVRVDEIFSSAIVPAKHLLSLWEQKPRELPASHEVWDAIRRADVRAASFPLGTVAERAVRRAVRDWSRQLRDGEDPPKRGELLHRWLALFVFETALLDLRGSSTTMELDYGFHYHWHDGKFRSAEEERGLRERLWQASCRTATKLLRAGKPGSLGAGPAYEDVEAALVAVFGRGPAARVGAKRSPRVVVRGPGSNVRVQDRGLVAACGGALDSRLRDLLDIAIVFYLRDIYVPRRERLGRELVCPVWVQNRRLWEPQRALLAQVGSFLTGNAVEFRFTGPEDEAPASPGFAVQQDARCVCLFSGGLDSFAGAASALAERAGPVYLVSQAASPALGGMQRRLFESLGADHARHVVFATGPESFEVPEKERLGDQPPQALYQHGRSFLFLSLATIVALSNGIADVFVYENGPVALNPPFSEARFNTRTTHPVFLALFGDLVREVFGVELRIRNPFELLTKGEVLKRLKRLDPRHLEALPTTNSCWTYTRVKQLAKHVRAAEFDGRHCGRCIPCVWRRAAMKRADLATYDDQYVWDAVPDEEWERWLDRQHFTVLLDLYRACRNALAARSDEELLDLCPELDEIGPGDLSQRLDLYRRYAKEIVAWFDETDRRMRYVSRS